MTKELHEDIKLHLDWLVKRLTDQGYELKQVVDLLKKEITIVRDNVIVDMSLDEIKDMEIKEITGYSAPIISTVLTNYWKSKKIGFKEDKERNI